MKNKDGKPKGMLNAFSDSEMPKSHLYDGMMGGDEPSLESEMHMQGPTQYMQATMAQRKEEIERLRALVAERTKERDKWHSSWKDLHNERQELRGVLGVPIPLGEGTVIQEFGPLYPLLESAKMIVKDRDEARAALAALEAKPLGCYCDLEEGMQPDGCVLDTGSREHCIYASKIKAKEECEYWGHDPDAR